MGFYLKLSFRNLARHKLRTIVSISAVVVGVLVVTFARGYVEGIIEGLSESYVHYNTGHIRIIDSEYRARERLLTLIHPVDGFEGEGAGGIIEAVEDIQGVRLAVPRIKFGAMAATEDELVDMAGWGVNPQKELKFTRIGDMIAEGRMVSEGREVLMGTALLKKLGIGVGDRVTIVYNTAFGSLGGTTFEVAGRVESGLRMLDEKVFFLPVGTAQELLYMEGQATEILLDVSSPGTAARVMPELEDLFRANDPDGRYRVIPWQESDTIFQFVSVARYIYGFIYFFIVILASFVVFNTMVMVVAERTREIGMMGALGMRRSEILRLFVTEGALKGIIGSFIGAVLGGALTLTLSITGIDLGDALTGASEEYLLASIVYPKFSPGFMVFGFLIGVTVVGVACYIPARKAAALQPTDALRSV